MSLQSSLSISSSGLAHINRQLAVVSQNIANAETAGYTKKTINGSSLTAAGQGMGVKSGLITRNVDEKLMADVNQRNATVAALTVRENLLSGIETAHGIVENGDSLGGLVGSLQNSFINLQGNPSSSAQQSEVVQAAASLATRINGIGQAVTTARQSAQDGLVSSVEGLNTALDDLGRLTKDIKSEKVAGRSTADLEDKRDAIMSQLSSLVGAKFVKQEDGGVLAYASGGSMLPLDGTKFSISQANVGPSAYYPGGGLPGITFQGRDVSANLTGGQIGEQLRMRDSTLPLYQAEIDEFAQKLASRFDEQGLKLFVSTGTNTVPAPSATPPTQTGYVGFAQTITINPAVMNQPSLLRDGTHPLSTADGNLIDFTPNPAGGPQDFTGVLDRIVDFTFGKEAAPGVPQQAFSTGGLGPQGNAYVPFNGGNSLADFSSALVASQTQDRAQTTSRLDTEISVQSLLQTQLSDSSGVNIDREMASMVTLQTSYSANARVLSAVQAMWDQLLSAVH